MTSRHRTSETTPLPEYEVNQYLPRNPDLSATQRRALRKRYGYVRAAFLLDPERHRNLQRWLNQARLGVTYDGYLTRSVFLAVAATTVGLLVGAGFGLLLVEANLLVSVQRPLAAVGSLPRALAPHRETLGVATLSMLSAVTFGVSALLGRYYYPRTAADMRGRAIDAMLPHAIVYLYALSYGGMSLVEAFRHLADSDDYGEVSTEVDMIVRDMDLFGNDLFTALRNARNLTPSDNFEQFADDLLGLLDAGGDVTTFLDGEGERYVREAMDEQEGFLETLSVLSEVFVAGFVAAPLLLIVTLMVISFLGGDTLTLLYALTYLVFPLGMVGFLLLLDMLSWPYAQSSAGIGFQSTAVDEVRDVLRALGNAAVSELRYQYESFTDWRGDRWTLAGDSLKTDGGAALRADPRLDAYHRTKAVSAFVHLVSDPLTLLRRQPLFTLVVTVPLVVAFLTVAVVSGFATVSVASFLATPLETTLWLFVVPFFVLTVPVAAFHEYRQYRERDLKDRFPDTLNVLSSANQMGTSLTESIGLVARWSDGTLATELAKLRNDINWSHDTTAALDAFANRLAVPELARVIRLIAVGGRSTGDLARILSVAADDTRTRYKLERARSRAMSSYVAIVLIGFLVYLFVILMLSTSYLAPMADLPTTDVGGNLPLDLGTAPVDSYRTLFFHSVLVQGVGSGLLAGKLADDDLLAGLKYSITLVSLTLLAFLFV